MSELTHHADQEHDDEAATVIPEQQEHDQVHHDHAHAADELRRNATGAHTHVHEHSHGEGGEVHSHSHAHVTDEQLHVHDHLHAYVDESTIPVLDEKGPAERLVTIFEATSVEKDASVISYVGTSGLKVTILDGLDNHKGRLTKLSLRSNLVAECKEVAAHGASLKHLELYDNRLRSLRGIEHCPFLEVVDVSYNGARDLAPVAVCFQLRELYAVREQRPWPSRTSRPILFAFGLASMASGGAHTPSPRRRRTHAGLQQAPGDLFRFVEARESRDVGPRRESVEENGAPPAEP